MNHLFIYLEKESLMPYTKHARCCTYVLLFIFITNYVNAQPIIYVNKLASGGNNGSSWSNAYTDLQQALNAATSGSMIWVAKGTHYPSTTSKTVSFNLKNNVSMFGGFLGTETSIDQRDININPTILSGNIGNSADSSDNSNHVVYAYLVNQSVIDFDGFVVEKGYGNVSTNPQISHGGGLYAESSNINIKNCKFIKNYSRSYGGPVYMANGEVTLINCEFISNVSVQNGGAVYSLNIFKEIRGCKFENNSSLSQNTGGYGGAICANTLIVYNSSFTGNKAKGGGAVFSSGLNSWISNCSFDSNYSTDHGGAIFLSSGSLITNNCTFYKNVVNANNKDGGALYSNGWIQIYNSIFTSNSATRNGGAVYLSNQKSVVINSIFNNNNCNTDGGAIYHIAGSDGHLEITNSNFVNNHAIGNGNAIRDYNSRLTKSKVTNCIFSDNGIPETFYQTTSGTRMHITYSIIQTADTGMGNIIHTPTFVNRLGLDNTLGTMDDNLRLDTSSIGIDLGNPDTSTFTFLSGDLDEEIRINNRIDIGAYERKNCLGTINYALAGIDTLLCTSSNLTLGANTPNVGVGKWNILHGSAIVQNINNPNTLLSIISPGKIMLEWTISHCGLKVRDTITIIRSKPVTNPNITASGPLMFCSGNTVTLSVPNSYHGYLWSTGDTTPSITVDTSSTYSIKVKNELNCYGEYTNSSATVVVYPLPPKPVISFLGDTILCENESIVLTAPSGFKAYRWRSGSINSSINVNSTKNESVSVQSSNNCWSPYSDTVKIIKHNNPITPILTITDSTSFCAGDSVIVSAPIGYKKYLWNTGDTTSTLTIKTSTTLSLYVTDSNTCKNNIAALVNLKQVVVPKPSIIKNNTSNCVNDSIQLIGPPNFAKYYWNDTISLNPSYTPNISDTFYLRVENTMGCVSNKSAPMIIYDVPNTPSISLQGDSTFCNGKHSILNTPANHHAYLWSNGLETPSITVNKSGTYHVSIIDKNGCKSLPSNTITIRVNPNPLAPSTTPTGNVSICSGDTIQLKAQSGFKEYEWNNGNKQAVINIGNKGVYKVRVTDSNNCISPYSKDVNISYYANSPAPVINQINPLCESDSAILKASGNHQIYYWSNNQTGQAIVTHQRETLTVYARDVNGCFTPNSLSHIVKLKRPAPLIKQISSSLIKCDEDADIYMWYKNGELIKNSNKPELGSLSPGVYSLITSISDCVSEKSNDIMIDCSDKNALIYPNPNNGKFTLTIAGAQQTSTIMNIYNVNGQLVFKEELKTIHCGMIDFSLDYHFLQEGLYYMILENTSWNKRVNFIIYK